MGLSEFFFGKEPPRHNYPRAKGQPKSRGTSRSFLSDYDFAKWSQGSEKIDTTCGVLPDTTKLFRPLFKALLKIPIVSGSVWAWKWITFTDTRVMYIGGTEKQQLAAKQIIDNFDRRVTRQSFLKGSATTWLLDQFFYYIFAFGRFSTDTILSPTNKRIDQVKIIDPLNVYFTRDIDGTPKPWVGKPTDTKAIEVNENSFFYYGLNMSYENPYGWAMLESTPTFLSINKEMMQDMRLSSHNAGLPRLHIKIKQPDIMDHETVENYESRINGYFDGTVKEMAEIGPDDNFYTWDDVEIGMASGQAGPGGFVWRTNRAEVTEEIITAFHLYPWIVGKSASTTKNWVQAQFNLLLNQAEALQLSAKQYMNWLYDVELKLHGITDVSAELSFERPRDPGLKDKMVAERFKIQNTNTMVRSGYISPDDASRRLGLVSAYDPERIYNQQKIKEGKVKEASPESKDERKEDEPDDEV